MDEFVTTEELAAELRVPVDTVHAWRYRGVGPPGVRIGRRVLYRRSDVDRWIAERAVSQTVRRGGAA